MIYWHRQSKAEGCVSNYTMGSHNHKHETNSLKKLEEVYLILAMSE